MKPRPGTFQVLAAGSLCLALAACGNSNLPDYNRLAGLRVLALIADTPEVVPGTPSVSITPVVSDLPTDQIRGGRTLTYSAEACVDPGVGLGASADCAARPDRVVLAPAGTTVTGLSAPNFTGATAPFSVAIPSLALTGRKPADQFNGVAYLVVYHLSAGNGAGQAPTEVTAFKRVIVSNKTSGQNSNPSIASITVKGGGAAGGSQELSAYLGALSFPGSHDAGKVSLEPTFAAGAGERQTFEEAQTDDSRISKVEELTTTWFVSDGDSNLFRTRDLEANGWYPPSAKPARGGMVFVIVARDGRGGENYRVFEF